MRVPIKTVPAATRELLAQYGELLGRGNALTGLQHGMLAVAPRTDKLVVIVHGTFANPTYDKYPSSDCWWSSYGSFAKALDQALERHGSDARCNAPVERLAILRDDRPYWLGWSGGNSEVERRQGAYELAQYLRALQSDDTIGTIHIVAHSHGGNVVRRALRYLNAPKHKLGRVICLGTPFLHFNDRAAWRRWVSRVHWPMLIMFGAIGAGLWFGADWFNDSNNQYMLYVVVGILFASLVSLWRYARSSQASSGDVPAIALQFAHDEAIQLLRACAAFTAAPHVTLRQLLGGTVPQRQRAERRRSAIGPDGWFDYLSAAFAVTGRAAYNTFAWISDLWNRPVCRAAERVTGCAWRVPLLGIFTGGVCTWLLIMGFRPYRPAVRPFLTSRLPRLRALFFHSLDEDMRLGIEENRRKADDYVAQSYRGQQGSWMETVTDGLKNTPLYPEQWLRLAAFAPVLLYWLFFYPLDKLVGLLPWLGDVGTRFFILIGARAAAGDAAGIDMLGAAFDARRTGEMPDGVEKVTIPAAIEKELEQRLDAAMRVNLAPLRDALDPATNTMMLDAVKTAFIEPGLLHAQYYQEERVVDFVAGLIAGTVEPGLWKTPVELTSEKTLSTPAVG